MTLLQAWMTLLQFICSAKYLNEFGGLILGTAKYFCSAFSLRRSFAIRQQKLSVTAKYLAKYDPFRQIAVFWLTKARWKNFTMMALINNLNHNFFTHQVYQTIHYFFDFQLKNSIFFIGLFTMYISLSKINTALLVRYHYIYFRVIELNLIMVDKWNV